jgi:hypothetical protein
MNSRKGKETLERTTHMKDEEHWLSLSGTERASTSESQVELITLKDLLVIYSGALAMPPAGEPGKGNEWAAAHVVDMAGSGFRMITARLPETYNKERR